MKANIILLLLSVALVLLLCGCGVSKKPAPGTPAEAEPTGDPLDITAFSFTYTASLATDCFRMELTCADSGTHLYAEELFSGGRIVDTVIEEDVLQSLGELAGAFHVERWDGFDKTHSNVMDGSRFSLHITLADGSTISAKGSNSFPENYAPVRSEVTALYARLMEEYSPCKEAPPEESPAPQSVSSAAPDSSAAAGAHALNELPQEGVLPS